jgi:hypothetical protein
MCTHSTFEIQQVSRGALVIAVKDVECRYRTS